MSFYITSPKYIEKIQDDCFFSCKNSTEKDKCYSRCVSIRYRREKCLDEYHRNHIANYLNSVPCLDIF